MKAVFYDRDGVINVDYGYVHSIDKFVFYEDIFDSIIKFKKSGYKLIIITNQSGIERGYYGVLDFLHISKYMQDEVFKYCKTCFDRIYFCKSLNDSRRKPNAGMILQAQSEFSLNLSECKLVGDKMSDIEAGKRAGIKELFLIDREGACRKERDYTIINHLKLM